MVDPAIEYRPVGFGSHHWSVSAGGDRWFLTVDDLDAKLRSRREARATAADRLRAALTTTRDLLDGGLGFVVAPRRAAGGDVLVPVGERFAAALYPHVERTPGERMLLTHGEPHPGNTIETAHHTHTGPHPPPAR